MSIVSTDLDVRMSQLESSWRQAFESSTAARAEYQALAAQAGAGARFLEMARKRLERAEALKARIMLQIERLENDMLEQN